MTDAEVIIADFIRVSLEVHPDLDVANGSITSCYKRDTFEDLFGTIGELYHDFIMFNLPTKTLTIDIEEKVVKITLTYDGLRVLLDVLPSMLMKRIKKEGK